MSSLFLNHAAGAWSDAIWRASWQGGLAVLLVWALTKSWQGMPPLLRCWLWRFAFIKFAVAFFCPTAIELAWLPPNGESSTVGPAGTDSLTPSLITHSRDKSGPEPTIADMDSLAQWPTSSAWLMLLWLGGIGIFSVRLKRGWWAARRLRLSAHPVDDSELLETVARLSERMGIAR